LDEALGRELARRTPGALVGFLVDTAVPAKSRGWVHVAACFARDAARAGALREDWELLWPPHARVHPPEGLDLAVLHDREGYDGADADSAVDWVDRQAIARKLPRPRVTGGADA
jgi:hypothetical protein